jgi:hypothetical protein
MNQSRALLASFLLMVITGQAAAQSPPVESVIVNGRRVPEAEVKAFVESRAAPTFRLGKIARWEEGICPSISGLKPEVIKFIAQRVRDVAAKAGAPVNSDPNCRANIDIVFTTTPQGLLDSIHDKRPVWLGYYDNSDQAKALSKVTHPIQGWYTTATIDLKNKVTVDNRRSGGMCLDWPQCKYYLPNATMQETEGSRLGDGLRAGLYHVTIVADPNKLVDHEVGTLADYIAMMSLAQPRSLDECPMLPSILNLLARDCATPSTRLSESDLGYLRGLYHMKGDGGLRIQQDEIAYQVKQTLGGR